MLIVKLDSGMYKNENRSISITVQNSTPTKETCYSGSDRERVGNRFELISTGKGFLNKMRKHGH